MASKSSIEAGRGHVTLSVDNTLLDKGLQAAADKMKSWGKGLITLGASIAAAGTLITAPFLNGLNVFSEWGKEVTIASRLTGIGFEAIQGIAASLRIEVDSLIRSVGRMNELLNQAAQGSAEASRKIQELGLDVNELLGPMSQEDRLRRFSEAIAAISDPAQRSAAARAIFGRGALMMDFSGGVEGVRQREARAREIGGVMSAADGELVKEYNKSLKEMKDSLRGLWASIGAAAAPAMKELFDLLVRIFVATRQWTEENRHLLDVIFRIADKVVLLGAVIGGLGTALYIAGAALSFFKVGLLLKTAALIISKVAIIAWTVVVAAADVVVGILTGEVGALTTAVIALGVVLGGFLIVLPAVAAVALVIYQNWDVLRDLFESQIGPGFQRFGETVMQTLGGIGDAIAAGDWLLAFDVAWAGIKVIFIRGWNWLANNWDTATTAIALSMVNMIEDVRPVFVGFLRAIGAGLFGLASAFEAAFVAVFNRIAASINGLIASSPRLAAAMGLQRVGLMQAGGVAAMERQFNNALGGIESLDLEGMRREIVEDLVRAGQDRGDAERRAEEELDYYRESARLLRERAEFRPSSTGEQGEGFAAQIGKGMILGGFSAQQAFGFLGAHSVSENPMQRLLRQANEQRQQEIDRLNEVVDQLRDIAARVAPRFA